MIIKWSWCMFPENENISENYGILCLLCFTFPTSHFGAFLINQRQLHLVANYVYVQVNRFSLSIHCSQTKNVSEVAQSFHCIKSDIFENFLRFLQSSTVLSGVSWYFAQSSWTHRKAIQLYGHSPQRVEIVESPNSQPAPSPHFRRHHRHPHFRLDHRAHPRRLSGIEGFKNNVKPVICRTAKIRST